MDIEARGLSRAFNPPKFAHGRAHTPLPVALMSGVATTFSLKRCGLRSSRLFPNYRQIMKFAFIGSGNMATALIGGLIKCGIQPSNILAINPNDEARKRTEKAFGIATSASAFPSLQRFDANVLAVKPQIAKEIAAALTPNPSASQLVISIVAGTRGADLTRCLGGHPCIVRAMPNTPALIGMSATGLVALGGIDIAARELASHVMGAVGQVVSFDDESKVDAVTTVSGSGPAYTFYFIDAIQEAARLLGMDDKQARTLTVATFTGTAQLATQSPESVSVLRERVTSRGGTTAAALELFDSHDLKPQSCAAYSQLTNAQRK
ncbi:pyrroline-5-carboxylate reductase (plasmid) [Paraburkholderia sp. PGU19]|nr:pyrroline-5-carboxylate reductase [Paraburkholderia sp. PGU19]